MSQQWLNPTPATQWCGGTVVPLGPCVAHHQVLVRMDTFCALMVFANIVGYITLLLRGDSSPPSSSSMTSFQLQEQSEPRSCGFRAWTQGIAFFYYTQDPVPHPNEH